MGWPREPTPEERDKRHQELDARERNRLQFIARHARAMVPALDDALGKVLAAETYDEASSLLRGLSTTFARALLRLLETV